jgi:CDP-4-dehydro-6-deoxyglucose reductase, E1
VPDSSVARRGALAAEIADLVERYFAIEDDPDDEISCPLAVPLYGAAEANGAIDALLIQRVTMGRRTREFEAAFAAYIGAEHAIMVNSGSSANLLAMAILAGNVTPNGLRPGDEVIVPAVTWATTIAPIVQMGCVPVFVDIDPDTLNLRADALQEAVSPRTRAIFAVHLLGNPADMDAILDFASRNDMWVLEDACESLGTDFGGRKVGTLGQVGTYSFYFSHQMTTVEGGMLVTDDPHLADLARSMRAHGWTRDMANRVELEAANPWIDPRFLFVHMGYNLRPTELSAAFGLAQLPRLDAFNDERRSNARHLLDELSDLGDELDFVTEQEGGRSTWFGFAAIARDADTRNALSRHLEERRIETRPLVAGNLTVQPAFRDTTHRVVGSLATSTAVGQRAVLIGNHPDLGERRIAHIVDAFRAFFGRSPLASAAGPSTR